LFDRYRSVKEAVKKPFIAKQLQDMGHHLGRHERVIFEAKKTLGKTEAKTKEAWNKYKENPTRENLNNASEQSGLNKEKINEAADNIETGIEESNENKSEQKFKKAEEKLKESVAEKGKIVKEKLSKLNLSIPSIIQGALRKVGVNLSKDVIRNILLISGGSSLTTMRGVLRKVKHLYNVEKLKSMKRNQDYIGIEKMHQKHISGGGTTATWNKWTKESKI